MTDSKVLIANDVCHLNALRHVNALRYTVILVFHTRHQQISLVQFPLLGSRPSIPNSTPAQDAYLIMKYINYESYYNRLCSRWLSPKLSYIRSTLVQEMYWYRQAMRHYMSQYWLGNMSPYGVTSLQWIKSFIREAIGTYNRMFLV